MYPNKMIRVAIKDPSFLYLPLKWHFFGLFCFHALFEIAHFLVEKYSIITNKLLRRFSDVSFFDHGFEESGDSGQLLICHVVDPRIYGQTVFWLKLIAFLAIVDNNDISQITPQSAQVLR